MFEIDHQGPYLCWVHFASDEKSFTYEENFLNEPCSRHIETKMRHVSSSKRGPSYSVALIFYTLLKV